MINPHICINRMVRISEPAIFGIPKPWFAPQNYGAVNRHETEVNKTKTGKTKLFQITGLVILPRCFVPSKFSCQTFERSKQTINEISLANLK